MIAIMQLLYNSLSSVIISVLKAYAYKNGKHQFGFVS